MLISQFKAALPYLFKAKLNALIWGTHASAKTSSVEQFAKENGHGFFSLRLGNMSDAGDILGMADFIKDVKGNKVATRFMMPDWLKVANDFCETNPDKYFILFLDEVNMARKDIRVPLMQILLENKLHTYDIHPNVRCVGAGNPPTDDYDGADDLSTNKAFASRWVHIKYQPSVQEWLQYQTTRGMDQSIINFIQSQPKLLDSELSDFSLDYVKPDRRQWENIDKLKKTDIPNDLLQELAFGLVGFTAYMAFLEHEKNSDKPLSADDILNNYSKVKKLVKKYADNEGESKTAILKYSCDNLLKEFQTRDTEKKPVTAKETKNVQEFLMDLPVGVAFAACQELFLVELFRPIFETHTELKEAMKKNKVKKEEPKE